MRLAILSFCLILCFGTNLFAQGEIKLATTTSTDESGLLDYILPAFEKEYNVKVQIISTGTGKAIKLAENGDVDIILVHARVAEDEFVDKGYGIDRRDVMYNDFIILGPKSDPAKIFGLKDAAQALRRIYNTKFLFISRGDDSGTDKKEKYLWSKAQLNPQGAWYLETGQGMSAALRIADEKQAYLVIDRATYLFNKERIRLEILLEGDSELFNPYGIIAVNPERFSHVKYSSSKALIDWIISPSAQQMIREYKVNGQHLFHPNARQYVGKKSK